MRSGVRASSRRLGALTAPGGRAVSGRTARGRLRPGIRLLVGVLSVGVALSGCAAGPAPVAAERIDPVTVTDVPFLRVDGSGTSAPSPADRSVDETTALAVLADLDDFATGLPDGPGDDVLSGGYAAVDPAPTDGSVLCVGRAADLVGTAFFCPEQDAIVADSAGLIPVLRGHYGDAALAVALAHEYGHAVQARGGWTGPDDPALLVELQADCFAGAFLGRATAGATERVHIPAGSDLRAIAPLLDFRDAPGSDPRAGAAHGSAVDRFRALDTGVRAGVPACRAMTGEQVLASTTLGMPDGGATASDPVEGDPSDSSAPGGGDGPDMATVLAAAGLIPPVTDPTTAADLDGVDALGPVARQAATALAQADAATGDDASRATCLLGAWAGEPSRRHAADQAIDYLRGRPDATYAQLQAFSSGLDGGAAGCG
ncbi:hypothetical protein JL107_06940 [Nakamurella flavida]|uniref:Peptidase n=1 Tax=Nakamurella flavida TaxID=363630 RepID=A0A939C2M8_9ACTN|nr:hypothetical protein [Nakamurella flavida]MBM9476176.1 hypothetical protein [Nakamurella flavida]MDP9777079.1 hypothetical protein [Nakamurella flavida]